MKKTHGLDVDQTTLTMGSLSTVPDQVISGLSLLVLCSLMLPSSDPSNMNGSSYGQKARLDTLEEVSVAKQIELYYIAFKNFTKTTYFRFK